MNLEVESPDAFKGVHHHHAIFGGTPQVEAKALSLGEPHLDPQHELRTRGIPEIPTLNVFVVFVSGKVEEQIDTLRMKGVRARSHFILTQRDSAELRCSVGSLP